jgi:hypothetical protein
MFPLIAYEIIGVARHPAFGPVSPKGVIAQTIACGAQASVSAAGSQPGSDARGDGDTTTTSASTPSRASALRSPSSTTIVRFDAW